MLATNNTVLFTDNGTTYSYRADLDVYSFGNYYNWYSATAGHGKYGDDYGEGYNAPGDICPAGWHLPKGGDKTQEATNEFWQLIVTGLNNGVNPANYSNILEPYYSGSTEAESVWNALRTYPNNFVNSGYLRNSSIYDRHYRGYYWSTSGTSISYAYSMSFMSDSVVPGGYYNGKNYGWAIRCIADI